MTQSIVFSPPVQVGEHTKHPEMLWSTRFGDLYVECKEAKTTESKASTRLQGLLNVAGSEYDSVSAWHEDLRLDVVIEPAALNGVETRIRKAIRTLHSDQAPDQQIIIGEVTVTF